MQYYSECDLTELINLFAQALVYCKTKLKYDNKQLRKMYQLVENIQNIHWKYTKILLM